MLTKGPLAAGERLCSSRAISSLPVPVSPVTSTEMSVPATFCTLRNTSCITGEAPRISPKRMRSIRSCSERLSSCSSLTSRALRISSEACEAKMVSTSRLASSNSCATWSLPT
jgi:hypothetical protein